MVKSRKFSTTSVKTAVTKNPSKGASKLGWLTGWSYRKSHVIDQAVGAGTNYPTCIKVYKTTGTDGTETIEGVTAGKVYVGNSVRDDFGDIRFTAANGTTLLSYWMKKLVYGKYAIFWVKVTGDLDAGNVTIYVYYNNASATTLSSASGTFILGNDFDDGNTTGLTINTAGSAVVEVPAKSSLLNIVGNSPKYSSAACLARRAGKFDSAQVRELGVIREEATDLPYITGGKIIAFYSAIDGASVMSVGYADSDDDGVTWGNREDTARITKAGTGWYKDGILQPSILRLANGTFYGLFAGFNGATGSIGALTSSDLVTWNDAGQKIVMGDYQLEDDSPLTEIGVPHLFKKLDGTYMVLFEAKSATVHKWRIFGATSADLITFTPMNSGYPILGPTGSGEEGFSVANGHVIEVSAGNFLIAYNGMGPTGDGEWSVCLASTSDFSTYTRHPNNPIIRYNDLANGVECSILLKDSQYSTDVRLFIQAPAGIPDIYLCYLHQGRNLHCKSTATADGWIIGAIITPGNYRVEIEYFDTILPDASSSDGEGGLGLTDWASVPSPMLNTQWNPQSRVFINRCSPAHASYRNRFVIGYIDTGGTAHFWTGSGWTTTASYITVGALTNRGAILVRLTDDGTNFKMDLLNKMTGLTIMSAEASIAKSSVKAFSNGVCLSVAEPHTNYYYLGENYDKWIMRKYVSPEPAHDSWGSEETEPAVGSGGINATLQAMDII